MRVSHKHKKNERVDINKDELMTEKQVLTYAKQCIQDNPFLNSMQLENEINKKVKNQPIIMPSKKKIQNLISNYRRDQNLMFDDLDYILRTKNLKQ